MKETNNGVAALAYILFFIPLIADGQNEDYRFHANQGLILFIATIILQIIGIIIPIIGWLIIVPLGWVFTLVFCILGIINAVNGNQKELPLIGGIKIIK